MSPRSVPLRYVALGDSYTIGTGVGVADRWPNQLVATLGPAEPTLNQVANLGVDGYATGDLVRHELPALDDLRPQFVSVLIGVNDVVRDLSPVDYLANVRTILDDLVGRVGSGRIVTVAVPDYTVTPAGADYGHPGLRHDAIVEANAVMTRETFDRGIAFVDIFDVSLRARDDRSLVADDGLHPSGRQYGLWVERIAPVVERLIGRP